MRICIIIYYIKDKVKRSPLRLPKKKGGEASRSPSRYLCACKKCKRRRGKQAARLRLSALIIFSLHRFFLPLRQRLFLFSHQRRRGLRERERQIGKATTPTNFLKRTHFLSITGIPVSGPTSPRPSTAVPSVIAATVFQRSVSSKAFS